MTESLDKSGNLQRTLGLLRPDALEQKENVLQLAKDAGLKLQFESLRTLSEDDVRKLLVDCDPDTVTAWSSQPVYAFVLEGPNAIEVWKGILGSESSKASGLCISCVSSRSEAVAARQIKYITSSTSSGSIASKTSPKTTKRASGGRKTATGPSGIAAPGQTKGSGRGSANNATPAKAVAPKPTLQRPTSASAVASAKTSASNPASQTAIKPVTSRRLSQPARRASSASQPPTPPPTERRSSLARARTTRPANDEPKSGTTAKSSNLNARQTSVHLNRTEQANRRASVASAASARKLSTTGGISKPPLSVLTGRTRKYSRAEKRPDEKSLAPTQDKPQRKPQPKIDEVEPEEEVKEAETKAETEPEPELKPVVALFEDDLVAPVPDPTESVASSAGTLSDIESWTKDCRQDDSEHDAEVAAATSAAMPTLERPSSARASFSPNSVASLPRPETPEVDQLRQRFETLAYSPTFEKRKTPTISPEIASRLKDLRPRGPTGTRVKTMVSFFMDENLHKWEF
ncbi:hypothetical protein CLU79DRAFT_848534 [Phycomyces nitens]|nr:hypothetical protein CLU79DRAFT_848534 [Phycomyces nitens]